MAKNTVKNGAKKKQKTPAAAETANAEAKKPAERKLSKKERKALEAERLKELKSKRTKYYGGAFVVAIVAIVISFASNSTYGQPVYEWIQLLCYLLLGLCGFIVFRGSKYEETERRGGRMNTMGMVFMMVALGMGVSQLVKWLFLD